MLTSSLVALQTLLENEGFTCKRVIPQKKASGDLHIPAIEELHVQLDVDSEERSYTVELTLQEKELELADETNNPPKKEMFLQFFLPLPFHITDESFGELARYLLLINKSLEFPGFGLDEGGRMIYYRHVLFFPDNRISDAMFLDFIGMIMLLKDVFSPRIEQIAQLDKTILDILNPQKMTD